ncbi:MAG: hypothetical protein U0X39_13240 [Bacteroidales bacterium]
MAGPQKTYLFCIDDHKNLLDDIRKRFCDGTRYVVESFHTNSDLLSRLSAVDEHNFCKVVIIGNHESGENYAMTVALVSEIKKRDPATGIIVLTTLEKTEEIQKAVRFNIDAFISRNNNTILRIHNTVKKLISEHTLLIYRRRRNVSVYVLLAFTILAIVTAIYCRFRLPLYF